MLKKWGYLNILTPTKNDRIAAGPNNEEEKAATTSRCLKIPQQSLIQHCERIKLRLHFEWTKVHKNAKNGQFGDFSKI